MLRFILFLPGQSLYSKTVVEGLLPKKKNQTVAVAMKSVLFFFFLKECSRINAELLTTFCAQQAES